MFCQNYTPAEHGGAFLYTQLLPLKRSDTCYGEAKSM